MLSMQIRRREEYLMNVFFPLWQAKINCQFCKYSGLLLILVGVSAVNELVSQVAGWYSTNPTSLAWNSRSSLFHLRSRKLLVVGKSSKEKMPILISFGRLVMCFYICSLISFWFWEFKSLWWTDVYTVKEFTCLFFMIK